jgi:[acyl-carrier-protein] S-malonyltransferase
MQEAVPAGEGGMAAVMGLEDDQVRTLCTQATADTKAARGPDSKYSVAAVVEAVNFNAPGQVVIAGSEDAVATALALLKTPAFAGGKAIPLPVSAPFHSSLMKPARDRMEALFADSPITARPKALLYPYLPNRTARLSTEPGAVFELLVEQVDHAVLWRTSMEEAFRHGARSFVEVGPGKVLQGLLKRISKPLSLELSTTGVDDPTTLKNFEAFLGR